MKRQLLRILGLCLLLPVMMTAAFVAEGSNVVAARIDSAGTVLETFDTLELALKSAQSGDVLRLECDTELTQDIIVPAGVTLVLPCIDNDPGYVRRESGLVTLDFNQDGTSTAGQIGRGPDAKQYCLLTIPEGITMEVQGTVMINAVTGRPGGGHYDQDVTGGYAQINLEGEIVVSSGGVMECFGYILGDGLVTAKSGGTVGDLYIVRNWRGGSQAEKMYSSDVYPMNEADCRNIEADVCIEYGGSYTGLVKMYANDRYYSTRFPQVDCTNGLIRLAGEDAKVLRSYDSEKEREIYEIHGGATFSNSSLFIVMENVSSSDFLYPIDGDMDFILDDGEYTFVNDYKFMTGSTMTVKDGATLIVAEEADEKAKKNDKLVTLVFYDSFTDKINTGNTRYPDLPAATLTLEEGAQFINKGLFAGKVYTKENNVQGMANAVWNVTTYEADGYFNTTVYPFTVTLNFALELIRPGYTWRFGEPVRGEDEKSIIWIKDGVFEVDAIAEQTTAEGVSLAVELYHTKMQAQSCALYVAAYDSNGCMLSVKVGDSYIVQSGFANAITDTVLMPVSDEAAYVKVFALDQNMVPLGEAAIVNLVG